MLVYFETQKIHTMKNQIKTILMSSAFVLFITSCTKESKTTTVHSTNTPETSASVIQGMRTAYANAMTDNDSLSYWYSHYMTDSTHCIAMMHRYDSMYHHQDSIMMYNYNTCHSSMNSGGGMHSGGGMMNGGGMMGTNNTTMDCTINGNDCTVMITSLHQQHIHHPTL